MAFKGFSMGAIKPAPKKAVLTIDATSSERVFGGGKTLRDELEEDVGPPRKKTHKLDIDLSDSYSNWKDMMAKGGEEAREREAGAQSNAEGEAGTDPAEAEREEARAKEFVEKARKGWMAPCTKDISELPDADTEVEIADFGAAFLRGLGWKDGEALGGKRKGLKESIIPTQRASRLGVGAKPPPVPAGAMKGEGAKLPHRVKRNAGPAPLSHG